MPITVSSLKELKAAVRRREREFIATGRAAFALKLIKRISPNRVTPNMSVGAVTRLLAFAGLDIAVAITIVIVLGVVTIVALVKDYNVEVDAGNDGVRVKYTKDNTVMS